MMKKVSIITVNYNGFADTCEMIDSFRKVETYPDYEIIVVDNGSKDVTEACRIRELYPDVLVIENTNTGFAGGNNVGIRQAKGNFIFCLNNDTIIKAPVLQTLVDRLEQPGVAGVSPLIRDADEPCGVQYYGYQKMTEITLRHTTPPYDESHPEKYLHDREIEVMHGAAMMLRRDAIDRVGLMFEGFFLFFEEFDWSYSLLEAGYKIWYEPVAVIYHKEGKSIGRITPLRKYYMTRARLMFARRHLKGWKFLASFLYMTVVVQLRDIFSYLLQRRFDLLLATIKGTFSGFTKVISMN